ncbi:MAG: hypothetical protein EA379_09835 [Phycisphaerales bacterium]|nr:MAG: hypothetical protein EA379_09835 [Phycisphaerales bacterium]
MDPVGLPIVSSIAGLSQAERLQTREQRRPGETARDRLARAKDEADLRVTEVEPPEAPRAVKGNDQEEAHEDRQANENHPGQAYYTPGGQPGASDRNQPPPSIDVEV